MLLRATDLGCDVTSPCRDGLLEENENDMYGGASLLRCAYLHYQLLRLLRDDNFAISVDPQLRPPHRRVLLDLHCLKLDVLLRRRDLLRLGPVELIQVR